ncbi:DUF2849 domain-containing protein [Kaistia geumhonensis]|uniref:Sulfite reductase (NADPH) hemoprotein beta-component n=1 Tax=Kaistia geumhonensis TaxID=410839 RepID=A0ABU0M5A1_9HYPH|nr:DUF2849 domain-containing protein [Kaistia geumhonensis]MCX5478766.1 DUF2849 domain-containing protein [Kaistia geumhonensis]MDQ0516015.1 sulfite reductase (NADPH) hemoprotein beta-component [Kaistia geumhonensis]
MTAKAPVLHVITANALGDGLVVFLTADGGWSNDIAAARVIEPDGLADAVAYGKAQHDARIVVEPYEIEVTVDAGMPLPVRLRERIRAERGPTVAYGEAEIAARAANSR